MFRDLQFPDSLVTEQDCDIARWACEVVATRAARLSAVGIAAVVKKTNAAEKMTGDIQVGVDGRYVTLLFFFLAIVMFSHFLTTHSY